MIGFSVDITWLHETNQYELVTSLSKLSSNMSRGRFNRCTNSWSLKIVLKELVAKVSQLDGSTDSYGFNIFHPWCRRITFGSFRKNQDIKQIPSTKKNWKSMKFNPTIAGIILSFNLQYLSFNKLGEFASMFGNWIMRADHKEVHILDAYIPTCSIFLSILLLCPLTYLSGNRS